MSTPILVCCDHLCTLPSSGDASPHNPASTLLQTWREPQGLHKPPTSSVKHLDPNNHSKYSFFHHPIPLVFNGITYKIHWPYTTTVQAQKQGWLEYWPPTPQSTVEHDYLHHIHGNMQRSLHRLTHCPNQINKTITMVNSKSSLTVTKTACI